MGRSKWRKLGRVEAFAYVLENAGDDADAVVADIAEAAVVVCRPIVDCCWASRKAGVAYPGSRSLVVDQLYYRAVAAWEHSPCHCG